MKRTNPVKRLTGAFTLIELMIVVLIVAILAAMILPVLSKAKQRAMVASCLNIQKQFGAGFQMYAGDNQEGIIGMGDGGPGGGDDGRDRNWRVRPHTGLNAELSSFAKVSNNQDANIVADQYGYKIAQMYPYAKNVDMVHCPADVRYRLPLNFAYNSFAGNNGLREKKTTDIKRPTERFLFIEENDPRKVVGISFGGEGYTIGENLGTWGLNDNAAWWDAPAVFHGNSGTFSFADGHAEAKKWLDACTRAIAAYQDPTGTDGKPARAQNITPSSHTVGDIGCSSGAGSPRDLPWVKLRYDGKTIDPANPIDW